MSHRRLVAWRPKRDLLTVGFLAVVMIVGTFLAGGVAAQPPCTSVSSHVNFQVQPSGALTVTFTGGIQGESVLTDQKIFSANDDDVPSMHVFIEKFDLTLKDGTTLEYTDLGVFDAETFKSSSLDRFTKNDGVIGDYGQLHETTVVATTFDAGVGTYRGEICLGDEKSC
jgi:hypothetical protein